VIAVAGGPARIGGENASFSRILTFGVIRYT